MQDAAVQVDERPSVDFAGARVLVTGGLGFIGSSLARRLVQAGAEVVVVDSLIPEFGGNLANVEDIRDAIQVNISDVRDAHSLKWLVRGQDFLFNLAGQTSHLDSMVDPFTDLEINCRAQLSLLEVVRHVNPSLRLVFASTRQIYGKPDYLPVDERHPIRPVDVNGINKAAGEWYHILYNKVYGIRSCALRLTNTYGPGMRIKDARQTFVGIWIRCVLEGRPFVVFGDGSQLRDFNYVDDVVDALLVAATHGAAHGRIFNLGGVERISLLDLAKLLVDCAGGAARFDTVPFPPERESIDIGDYYADFGEITKVLGWRPRTPLADGLRRTLDNFRGRLAEYV
jgi:UDP-glucose 4-epimerase